MRLDRDRRGAGRGTALDDVRVQRPLSQEARVGDRLGLLPEDFDERVADDFSLLFRIGDAGQSLQEKVGGVGDDQVYLEMSTERGLHILRASFIRSSPLSTKMQCSRSPMALCSSMATTEESTPPERPQTTSPSPTCSRMHCTLSATKAPMHQSRAQPQTSCRKLPRISAPRGVWETSGWNCTP